MRKKLIRDGSNGVFCGMAENALNWWFKWAQMRRINHLCACIAHKRTTLCKPFAEVFTLDCSVSIGMFFDEHCEIPQYSRINCNPILFNVLQCIDLFFSLSLLLLLLPILIHFLFSFCTIRIVCGNFFCSFQQCNYILSKKELAFVSHNDNALTTIFDWHVFICLFVYTLAHTKTAECRLAHTHSLILLNGIHEAIGWRRQKHTQTHINT